MIVVVGTMPGSGKGGIATAISYFYSILTSQSATCFFVVSHKPGVRKIAALMLFFFAVVKVICYRFYAVFLREEFIVYAHLGPKGSLIRKLILGLVVKLLFGKFYVHHHSPIFERYLMGGLFGALLRCLYMISDKNFVLTSWWAEKYSEFGLNDSIVMSNCVDAVKDFNEVQINEVEVKILTVARLVEEKNVQAILRSLVYLPINYSLIIAGDGPYLPVLRELVVKLKIETRVSFLGWVKASEKVDLYKICNVFALPSNYDSFGMVYVEALAHGLPVVYGCNPAVAGAINGLYGAHSSTNDDYENIAMIIRQVVEIRYDRARIHESVMERYSLKATSDCIRREFF